MIFFPAIDIKDSKCVRLYKGDMNQSTIFNNDPASQALEFEKLGFKFIHLVDLDGALNGKITNKQSINEILKSIKIPVQLGGGIRSLNDIEEALSWGINRVILGTIALKNPQLVIEACKKFHGKIVIGIDAKNGKVATQGWVEDSKISAIELGKRLEYCGASAIIYTDISRDGTMSGFDSSGTKKLAENLLIPIIASGGVASIEDIKKIRELKKDGVIGAIVGRALYEKKIAPSEII
ncbi:MAG: 1-(5-phosphoribosyl)-5-[(5-phosphoribosylamino)methylideneamino]imidazole-4-carboxamide isomerase [Proteobacteria bacterium]|nr:1-(5-phosphoribosyl)-5-[(5-phosphoribosylamino)methylideneamino]imidazole-4-carboxamide isomerase [Pseudomonadota bacterium]NCA28581.1 1-(5-phosphoribosyl)-5-[(5-phosphoribosylamino)methylideneamino]imidazole-4-carboxamide isomerase [Pseudomonadota bacterium]